MNNRYFFVTVLFNNGTLMSFNIEIRTFTQPPATITMTDMLKIQVATSATLNGASNYGIVNLVELEKDKCEAIT